MKRVLLPLFVFVLALSPALSQTGKKPITFDDIEGWKRITENIISPDGKYVAYKTEPWKGDPEMFVYNLKGERVASFKCGTSASFTYDSRFLVFDQVPGYDIERELKIKKTKKEDMPLKSSVIYDLKNGTTKIIERARDITVPGKWGGWVAFQIEPGKAAVESKPSGKEGEEESPKAKKIKKESSKNGYNLYLLNTDSGDTVVFPYVTFFRFADESPALVFISSGDDNDFSEGIYHYAPVTGELKPVMKGKGSYKQAIISDNGSCVAFLADMEEEPSTDKFSLYYWNGKGDAAIVADNSAGSIPEGWEISENGRLQFSGNITRLFFGTAPVMPVKDTLRLDDEYPNVDIWHGTEGKLHTVQVIDRSRDMKRSWMAVADLASGKILQLGTPDIPEISLIDEGNAEWVLAQSNVPYELQTMWEGSPEHYDVYLMSLATGERKLLKRDIRAAFQPSPAGKYLAWYDYMTGSMYTYEIATGREYLVTTPDKVVVAQEMNDIPNPPSPYRQTGWLENDEKILVNDRYDIWLVDPKAESEPVNITVNGRSTLTGYSAVVFDRDKKFFKMGDELLLSGQNDVSRESGYYSWKIGKAVAPSKVMGGAYALSRPVKASQASTVIYSKETFEQFPDLFLTDLSFRKNIRISDANPQQKDFIWGTAELYTWSSLDGRQIDGLLYKPANFDPSKKYPMIVNFYEKSSSELYSYRNPELHRSTIDYHYYTGNGYIVFNPDIYYEDGYPGESAFNCVMPGITALIAEGFVDRDRIGAQGHSWGGYQVAYLATRTDLFAAIESGAPVVNMFSAYGGIRWWTGLNRSFQYEHTQSRIGATIWEAPLRYLENSPLFTMDKVTTPILIMANDADGHVPWYQGIEYFSALRRLEKPVWMLNYTGEPHWPQNFKNKKDFQIRMAQFFDHYLKDKPMPKWMDEGIPAIMKDYDLGYELITR